jgi:hypothetical protein
VIRNNIVITVLFASFALFTSSQPVKQARGSCDSTMSYVNHNQLDPPALLFSVLSGKIFDGIGEGKQAKNMDPVPEACIGLFTEQEHKLVMSTISDKKGYFKFGLAPKGRYRLIVKAEGLCTANIPLLIIGEKQFRTKQLIVNMRIRTTDGCSYGSYK